MAKKDRQAPGGGRKEPPMAQERQQEPAPADSRDEALVARAYGLFDEYIQAYAQEWQRIDECERLYRGEHWQTMAHEDGEPTPVTPILHSTVESVAADIVARAPQAIIEPESPMDTEVARVIGALIRQNHDASDYRSDYRRLCHDLLVSGYCVQEVGYDPRANNGIGSAYIRYVDCRNMLFDPQADNIPDCRAIFKIQARPIRTMDERYPHYAGQFTSDVYDVQEDGIVAFDRTKSVLEIEYWWREFVADGGYGRYVVHMARLAGHKLLEDSRETKPEGYFASGDYPFFITTLFARKGSVLGLGFCDVFGEQQKYADKLDQIVLINSAMGKSNKLLVTEASGFDPDDLRDWAKEVHVGQQLGGVTWFSTPPLPQYVVGLASQIREGIKQESGANDVSRGNVGGGVTSASAIQALQEASSKRARQVSDMLHETFKKAVRMEIEVEREYNVLPRAVSYLDERGNVVQGTFASAMLTRVTELGNEVPVEFLVSIKVQQESRWTIQAHNDLIIQMVQLQMLTPEQGLELMEFEGREQVLNTVNADREEALRQQQAAQAQAAEEQAQLEQQMAMLPQPGQPAR